MDYAFAFAEQNSVCTELASHGNRQNGYVTSLHREHHSS